MKRILLLSFLTAIILLQSFNIPLFAQSIDESFNTVVSAYGNGRVVKKLVNNKILLVGNIQYVNGFKTNDLVLFNADGSVDESFTPPIITGGQIHDILELPDSGILLGGSFESVDGKALKNLIKIKADGSLDESFMGGGPNAAVFNLEYQISTKKIIIFGFFSSYQGGSQSRALVRIDQSGNLDNTFNAQELIQNWGYSMQSNAGLAVQKDGKILYSNNGGNRIVRLLPDGEMDDSFSTGTGLDKVATNIIPNNDGTIYFTGSFSRYNGVAVPKIMRVLENGALDQGFSAPLTGYGHPFPFYNERIYAATVTSGNKLILGGEASDPNKGSMGAVIYRLNTDGSLDSSFSPVTNSSGSIVNLDVLEDDSFFATGHFLLEDGKHCLLKLNTNGSKDAIFSNMSFEKQGIIFRSLKDQNGKLLFIGDFNFVNHTAISSVARLHQDGSLDGTFSSPLSNNFYQWKEAKGELMISPAGEIFIGGSIFHLKNGTRKHSVLKLKENGLVDAGFSLGADIFGYESHPLRVNALKTFQGNLLVMGDAPYSTGNIFLVSYTGALQGGFTQGQNFGFSISKAAIQQDSLILIAGEERSGMGKMIRLNKAGGQDLSFEAGHEFSSYKVLLPLADGKILVGGRSATATLKRFNTNGTVDPAFSLTNSGHTTVHDVLSYAPDKWMVAGNAGVSAHHLDGSLDAHFKVPANEAVYSIMLTENSLFATGVFSKIGNSAKGAIAKVNYNRPSSIAPANFVANGLTNSTVKLSWAQAPGSQVMLERSENPGGPFTELALVSGSDTTFTDQFTVSNTTYFYRASYVNFLGQGAVTDLQEVKTPESILYKPHTLQGELADYVNVMLNWKGTFANVVSFKVEAYTDTLKAPVSVYTTATPSPSFAISGLKESTRYFFKVRVNYGQAGISDPSGWFTVKTERIPFYQPYNLQAEQSSYRRLGLSWEDSSSVTKYYKLFRFAQYNGTSGGRYIATIPADQRFYIDEEVEAGYTYQYRLDAYREDGAVIVSTSLKVVMPNSYLTTSTQKAALATGRSGAVGFSIFSKGYIGLGLNGSRLADLWEYDPASNTWQRKADYPGGGRNNAIAFVIGDKAYVGLGRSDSGTHKDFYQYDPASNSWTKLADFPDDHAGNSGLANGISFVLDGIGYVSLGTRNGVVNNGLYAYDPATNTWTKKESFPGSVSIGAVSWTNNGSAYVGFGGVLTKSNEVWKYEPQKDSWRKLYDSRSPSARTAAVAISTGRKAILATGDVSTDFFKASYTQEVYYFSSTYESWTRSGFTSVFTGPARAGAAGFAIGNRVYLATGNSANGYLADLWEMKSNLAVAPEKVLDLRFEPVSSTSGYLKWKLEQDNEEGISVELASTPGGPFGQVGLLAPGVNQLLLENLSENNTYYIRVRSFNSDASSEFTYAEIKMTFPPQAPAGLAASLTENNKISLSWTDLSDNETSFEIWRKEASSNSSLLVSLPANTVVYTDESAVQNTSYSYFVLARNEGGASSASNSINISTGYNKPSTPIELSKLDTNFNSIIISWTNPTPNVETEIWVKSGEQGTFMLHSTIDKYSNLHTVTGLVPDKTCYIKIRAKNNTQFSDFSNELIQKMPPSTPVISSVEYTEKGKVKISWVDHSEVEEGFMVLYHQGDEKWITLDTLSANEVSYTHMIAEKNIDLYYSLIAFNEIAKSDLAAQQHIYIYSQIPDAPYALEVTKTADDYVVNWQVNPEHKQGVVLEYRIKGSSYNVVDTFAIATKQTSFQVPAKTDSLWFRAWAFNLEGNSAYSKEASIEVTSLPLAPKNLRISKSGTKQIRLDWEDRATNEDGYIVEYRIGEEEFRTADTLAANTINYTYISEEVKGNFTFRVSAFNITGTASSSGEGVGFVLGTKEMLLTQYRVYPNPTRDLLTIEGDFQELRIYNNQGLLLSRHSFEGRGLEQRTISLEKYPPGMYHIEVKSGKLVSRRSIIKM